MALYYDNTVYRIKQKEGKRFPNANIHDKETLRLNNLGFEIFQRINFGRRGNFVGKFIDMGLYYNWAFDVKHAYKDKIDQSNNPDMAKNTKIINRNLNYIDDFNYGLRARLGFNRSVLTFTYRLSDLFDKTFHNNEIDIEMPRFTLGIQLGIHK